MLEDAARARRIAGALSEGDAAKLRQYAEECEDAARQPASDGADGACAVAQSCDVLAATKDDLTLRPPECPYR
jgi:HPt (histidine-containing phosphotransfer) domain-containing protein